MRWLPLFLVAWLVEAAFRTVHPVEPLTVLAWRKIASLAYIELLPTRAFSLGNAIVQIAGHVAFAINQFDSVPSVLDDLKGQREPFRPVAGYPHPNPTIQHLLQSPAFPHSHGIDTIDTLTIEGALRDTRRLPLLLYLFKRPGREQNQCLPALYGVSTPRDGGYLRIHSLLLAVLSMMRFWLDNRFSCRHDMIATEIIGDVISHGLSPSAEAFDALVDLANRIYGDKRIKQPELMYDVHAEYRKQASQIARPHVSMSDRPRNEFWPTIAALLIPGVGRELGAVHLRGCDKFGSSTGFLEDPAIVPLSLVFCHHWPIELMAPRTGDDNDDLQLTTKEMLREVHLDQIVCSLWPVRPRVVGDWRHSPLPLKVRAGVKSAALSPEDVAYNQANMQRLQTIWREHLPPELAISFAHSFVPVVVSSESLSQTDPFLTILLLRPDQEQAPNSMAHGDDDFEDDEDCTQAHIEQARLSRELQRRLPRAVAFTRERPSGTLVYLNASNTDAWTQDPHGWLALVMPMGPWTHRLVATLHNLTTLPLAERSPGRWLFELMPLVQDAGLGIFQVVPSSWVPNE